MKLMKLIKEMCLLSTFMVSLFVFAQNTVVIDEALPTNTEKLEVIFPKTVWLGKSKVKVNNYGVAKIKEGITSIESKRKRGVTYSETNFKFKIDFSNVDNETANLVGRTVQSDEYIVSEDILLNDIIDIGVEASTIEDFLIYPKTLKATITTNMKSSKPWEFVLKTTNQNHILNIEIGSITNGERSIKVIQTSLEGSKEFTDNESMPPNTLFYEFIENGKSLGAVTYDYINSMWLNTNLDPTTKLVLCIAMLSIAY